MDIVLDWQGSLSYTWRNIRSPIESPIARQKGRTKENTQ